MTEQRSPWASPDTHVVLDPVGGGRPLEHPSEQQPTVATGYRSGNVSSLEPPQPPPDVLSSGPDDDDPMRRNQRIMKWFGVGAVAVVAIGLVVVLGMVMTGNTRQPGGLFGGGRAEQPTDTRPELVKRCPPPSIPPERSLQDAPGPPPGPRIVDGSAGISYKQYGDPWLQLDRAWVDQGEFKINYESGQHFVTEPLYDGRSDFHATILSGHVPAAHNDGLVLDLKCVGHQVAADVRVSFYPRNNSQEMLRDEQVDLGGRPAWVMKFRLHYSTPGLKAKSELVSIALIDVGRPEAAILYVSIPDTHRQFDYIADEVLDSVRIA